MKSFHDFSLRTIDDEDCDLGSYAGKVLLVVNVASECGLTPQYAGLQRLQECYGERGFEVLGIPCNQFAGQEPGNAAEIKEFCTSRFGVGFPLFAKLEVNGPGRDPLYAWMTALETEPEGPGDVKWNFGKFLVARDGQVVARFEPTTEPEAADLLERIERAL